MDNEFKENKLYEIFIDADDFCKSLEKWLVERGLSRNGNARKTPQPRMSVSEILTIICFYHYSGYKNFQYYYEDMVLKQMSSYFPGAVSYGRFVAIIHKVFIHLYLFAFVQHSKSKKTGRYFIDSKKLPVCDNRRIASNCVFKGLAKRGKSSTGWFFGLKLHLIINNLGQVMNFALSAANVSDNDPQILDNILNGLEGKCYGDKGYLSKLFEKYYMQGIQIITKLRKNMKNKLMQFTDKLWLRKRAVIESVNDILMTVFDIDHTRHRSPVNAMAHIIGGMIAYSYYDEKPCVFIPSKQLEKP
jgi:hypothetical protein